MRNCDTLFILFLIEKPLSRYMDILDEMSVWLFWIFITLFFKTMNQALKFFVDTIDMYFKCLKLNNQQLATIEISLRAIFGYKNVRRKRTVQQVRKLFYLNFVKNVPANRASIICGINPGTGTGYIRKAKSAMVKGRGHLRLCSLETANTWIRIVKHIYIAFCRQCFSSLDSTRI